VIADILLEKALSIVTTDHWVWELQILDDGLQLSLVLLGDTLIDVTISPNTKQLILIRRINSGKVFGR
jgi:hypothetical protein